MSGLIELVGVTKTYGAGPGAVTALDRVDIELAKGSFTAVMGPSGSGKSTFLHCAAGLDRPTSGTVRLAPTHGPASGASLIKHSLGETDLSVLKEAELTAVRRERIGFVFQAYNLVPSLTVEQNITLPLRLSGRAVDRDWLLRVVREVGLDDRLSHRPSQLSGGQQQRVAVARALVTRPDVIFADEPTGALDTRTGRQILQLLRDIVDRTGQTVLMVTHDPVAASFADRVAFLSDGRLAGFLDHPTPDAIAASMTHLGEW